MADETATPESVSPFRYGILPSLRETVGKAIYSYVEIENGIAFIYEDKTALIVGTKWDRDTETSSAAVIPEEEILEYFSFKNLAKSGLLTHLYMVQQIGKDAGLNIVPTTEGGDTFRIDLTV